MKDDANDKVVGKFQRENVWLNHNRVPSIKHKGIFNQPPDLRPRGQ